MATISTLVDRREPSTPVTGYPEIGVFFTAPFDCIVGIEIIDSYPSLGSIFRDKSYRRASSLNLPLDTPYVTIAQSISIGSKIASVILKSGESLRTNARGNFVAYITGVSA